MSNKDSSTGIKRGLKIKNEVLPIVFFYCGEQKKMRCASEASDPQTQAKIRF